MNRDPAPGRSRRAFWRLLATAVLPLLALPAAAEPVSRAPNYGSVTNTRHNLTQSYLGGDAGWMSLSRNNYGQVCVYCHTPHGANTTTSAPLWNRTMKATTYTTYNRFESSYQTATITQPGAASLSCLSCHDGQTAIDSVINMPGSGRYRSTQMGAQDTSFLDSWPGGPGESFLGGHGSLNNSAATMNNYGECQSCHSVNGDQHDPSTMAKFDVFFISTDLRDDHPVGIAYPSVNGTGTDWNTPTGTRTVGAATIRYFDEGPADGRLQKTEIRLYDSGQGPEVECATCHDPHGVPSGGPGSNFMPSFLRKTIDGSSLCFTCHAK